MPITNNIYWEKQNGGLCRLHSINAYYGKEKYSINDFNILCNEYDSILKTQYKNNISCKQFDLVNANQQTIVSYILQKNKIHSIYVALNYIKKFLQTRNAPIQSLFDLSNNVIFVYNHNHIWTVRKHNGRFFKVDSLSGVRPFNVNSLQREKNIGIIIPISDQNKIINEYNHNISRIKDILDKNNAKCVNTVKNYLTSLHKKSEILGDLEILIGTSINMLKILEKSDEPIVNLISIYYDFLNKFIGNYLDIDLILEYVPKILLTLIDIKI